jgi:hypothetical protein
MLLNNTPSNYICLLINIPDVSKFTAIQRSAFNSAYAPPIPFRLFNIGLPIKLICFHGIRFRTNIYGLRRGRE